MILKPDFNLDSIYEIDAEKLKELGVKALFFDLDSTVMKSKSGVLSEKARDFLEELAKDFKIAIVTNNKNKNYIEKASSCCTMEVYGDANKPNVHVLKRAMKDLGAVSCESAFIGDRPLTDILAGKRAKMLTILVDSISREEEHVSVRFIRWVERLSIRK